MAVRVFIVALIAALAYALQPFQLAPQTAAAAGAAVGLAAVCGEFLAARVELRRSAGAAAGGAVGLLFAAAGSLVLAQVRFSSPGTQSFVQIALCVLLVFAGSSLGFRAGARLNRGGISGWMGGMSAAAGDGARAAYKILDTSVIIDGRIADIAETGFLDGILITPQFVLSELQMVADSSDSMKRNRGRRGLDVLQRMQKMPHASVRIVEQDFPHVREVDLKLIELAKAYDAKIVTNDFNLNKVAQLRGVEVLNINELANALKPIVLPGESMRVFILKEGKEYNQGVAYLDDGTMVVVDNAKRMISKTIDVTVTSVLQTTAGKMIFGKHDERTHAVIAERGMRKDQAVGEG